VSFERSARAALADEQLRGALRHATTLFGERRRAAMATLPDWEGARDRARAIKDETLLHLDRYLEEFTANAERAGARVHWARDAATACEIIGRIAAERGARTVVKSKSMASEEIHLNAALAARGLEPVETDLGEYIVQLAGEGPSHIVAPAIHKTRGQIAALFAEKLGVEPSDDVAALAAAARQTLRRRFAEADLGISGVNFAVAETGTILIVENEGNARLTTTLPRTHVALMGIEKVIPRFADLEVFLQLLPRSGTGQRMTAYQSLLTGAKRRPDDEGPRAAHRGAGQRPVGHARVPSDPADARVYSLRRVPQRLSGVPADRRPRVRVCVCRSDRRRVEPAALRPGEIVRAPLRLEPVWRLP